MINFKKIIIHHFLSYDHAEIELQDKGYCLVKGVNRNPKDSAKSNGSGKSTIFNAISFALTGETLQGLKSNLANIYYDDGCYVKLDLDVDGHNYSILRSKEDSTYGSDLKITVDGVDKSGKTLTESKAILEQYIPDLTSELIGSAILIGQGMPQRFTANSPSGRKEVLEHLSQSDFMIQDIKERIARRQEELASQLRKVEDKILECTTQESVYTRQLTDAIKEYDTNYSQTPDFEFQLNELEKDKNTLNETLSQLKKSNDDTSAQLEESTSILLKLTKDKESHLNKFVQEHSEVSEEFTTRKTDLMSKKIALEQEIKRLKSITDICPTCGQKIPGANKPDTSAQEQQLQELLKKIDELNKEISEDTVQYNTAVQQVKDRYDNKILDAETSNKKLNTLLRESSVKVNETSSSLKIVENKISVINKNKEFFETNKSKILKNIQELQSILTKLSEDKKNLTSEKEVLDEHSSVISKMNTIVKRDFRGFLLKSIIDYINSKAKEYASQVFGCNDIEFILEGNNINISFCDKDYENLSGGEKTKIDLLIQFSIRDMIREFRNFSSNILVLDEVLDFLDKDASDRVLSFITNNCNDVESVFMVSHHDDLEIPYDSELLIEKNDLGVSNVIH